MRRTNTWADATATQEAALDLGDGLNARIPLGRPYTIDQSAGRVVKIWDYLNKREQVIFGDTGWRLLENVEGVTGTIMMRRVLNTVTIRLVDVMPVITSRSLAKGPTAGFLPANQGTQLNNFVTAQVIPGAAVTSDWHRIDVYRYGVQWQGESVSQRLVLPSAPLGGQIVYTTDDPWPATLPGTPA